MAHFSFKTACKHRVCIKFILFFALAFLVLGTAFKPIAGLDEVIQALRGGNTADLAKYIDEQVELTIPGKSNNYSRSQATVILQDFLSIMALRILR